VILCIVYCVCGVVNREKIVCVRSKKDSTIPTMREGELLLFVVEEEADCRSSELCIVRH